MKYNIETSVKISASASKVWEVLTDLKAYPSWNPFITKLEGDLEEGEKLNAIIGGMKFKPTIMVLRKTDELRWLGRLLFPGIFDGEHRFQIIENGPNSCTFIQSEKFNGILVGMFKKKLDTETVGGFEAMNEALKHRCEKIEELSSNTVIK